MDMIKETVYSHTHTQVITVSPTDADICAPRSSVFQRSEGTNLWEALRHRHQALAAGHHWCKPHRTSPWCCVILLE